MTGSCPQKSCCPPSMGGGELLSSSARAAASGGLCALCWRGEGPRACPPSALVQTQTVRALYRVAVFPAGVISSSTLAGHVRCSSCAKRLIDPSEISQGSTSGLGGNGRPVCRGERAFTCPAASALGRAWKWIRWLQGDNFWHPGVVLPSLDISALSRVLLRRALAEMCVSARAASVWSHGDVDEQLAPTYSACLLLSVCNF